MTPVMTEGPLPPLLIENESGAGGIRTLGRILRSYNGLANHRLQPLGHSSLKLNILSVNGLQFEASSLD
jgi:hypothetical protein